MPQAGAGKPREARPGRNFRGLRRLPGDGGGTRWLIHDGLKQAG